MWLAVDAGAAASGAGLRAWPVDGDGARGAAIAASGLADLLARPRANLEFVAVDGADDAPVMNRPAGIADLAASVARRGVAGVPCAFLPRLALGGAALGSVARLAGALRQMQAERPAARAQHVCLVGGEIDWAHATEGRVTRLRRSPTGARLEALLRGEAARKAGAADEDDDVAFERGLSLSEDGGDPKPRIADVLKEAASGARRGGALGAMLAGVLVGADAARGLALGRLGGPLALVGPSDPRNALMAQRYATALGRFGVAVRRLDPLAALIGGCRALVRG